MWFTRRRDREHFGGVPVSKNIESAGSKSKWSEYSVPTPSQVFRDSGQTLTSPDPNEYGEPQQSPSCTVNVIGCQVCEGCGKVGGH
jgi:hypothetical protein